MNYKMERNQRNIKLAVPIAILMILSGAVLCWMAAAVMR